MISPLVLLVDDEVPFVETMSKRLSKRQLMVLPAYTGREALEMLGTNAVDVVILDVKMPGMDGIQTLRQIKQTYPLVEVIMLTGHATIETAVEGMRLGAFDYLMKPCEIEELLAKVSEAKEKKSKHEQKIMDARMKEITLRRGM
jgi:DNA-binding NtrC family response regulator